MNPQVAARAAARKGPPPAGVNFQRQNQQQLQEQAAINRERRKQAAAEEERKHELKQKLAAQYAGSASRHQSGAQPTPTPQPRAAPGPARGPPVAQGERIEVFIRETDPGADDRAFAYFEGEECVYGRDPSPPREPVKGYSAPAQGAPGGMRGAARRTSGGPAAAAQQRAAPSPGAQSRAPSEAPSNRPGPRPGQVPKYLLKRKQELEDEKEVLRQHAEDQAQAAKYPPGMVPLEEDKRLIILRTLGEKKEEIMGQINRLPMRFDTQSVQKRRNALEEAIREVEAEVAKFSRKQVFVPVDAY